MDKYPPSLPSDNVSYVIDKLFSSKVRFGIYAAAFLAAIVLVIIGVLSTDEADKWMFFAGNVLGIGTSGLALLNRPYPVEKEK